jgi:hypothetical protein
MSGTLIVNARGSAMLAIALLVALPGLGEAGGRSGGQDSPERPALGALAAAQKARTVVTVAGQPQAPRPTTIAIKQNLTQTSGATGSRGGTLAGGRNLHLAPPSPRAPTAMMEKVRVIPYQPIRITRPSVPSVKVSLRAAPSAPRVSMAPARVGSE